MAAELPPASGILTESRLDATTGGSVTSLNSLKVRTDRRREMVRRSDDNSRGKVQNVRGDRPESWLEADHHSPQSQSNHGYFCPRDILVNHFQASCGSGGCHDELRCARGARPEASSTSPSPTPWIPLQAWPGVPRRRRVSVVQSHSEDRDLRTGPDAQDSRLRILFGRERHAHNCRPVFSWHDRVGLNAVASMSQWYGTHCPSRHSR